MKPYSKKYLTLALAGVLAASIPASAFAANDNVNEAQTGSTTTQEESLDNRSEAQKSDLRDIDVTIEKGDSYYTSNIIFQKEQQ